MGDLLEEGRWLAAEEPTRFLRRVDCLAAVTLPLDRTAPALEFFKARVAIERALDVVALLSGHPRPHPRRGIGLCGYSFGGMAVFMGLVCFSGRPSALHQMRTLSDPLIKPAILVTREMVGDMHTAGLDVVGEAVCSGGSTEVLRRVVFATRWYGDGWMASDDVDAFVKYSLALDALLGQEERNLANDTLTARVSERVAFLLGTDRETRKATKKRLTELLRLRGDLVHGRQLSTQPRDLTDLESLVQRSTIRVVQLSETISTFQQLLDWFDDRKFGV